MFTPTVRRIVTGTSVVALAIVPVVGVAGSAFAASTFGTLIETASNHFQGTYANSFVNPADGTVAFASNGQDIVTIIDAVAGTAEVVTDSNSDINDPAGLAYSPDGTDLYVANEATAAIAVIDAATNTVVDTIATVNSRNISVAVSPDGRLLLVGDNFDDLTAYDLTNNATVLWNVGVAGDWNHSIYFNGVGTALLVDYYGSTQTVNLATGSLTALTAAPTASRATSSCANEDQTVIGITNYNQSINLFDAATWESLGTVDLTAQGADALVACAFTSNGQILAVDWNYSVDDSGQVFVVDATEKVWLETIYTPGVTYTTAVAFLDDCSAVIAGYYTNAATLTLDSSYCKVPEPENTGEVLAETGTNSESLNASAIAALSLLVAGAVAVASVRRRTT